MTRRSNKEDALVAMREANPAAARELREAVDEETLARAMQRAIADGDAPSRPIPAGDRAANDYGSHGGHRRGLALALGAGLACLAAVATLLIFGGGSVGGSGQPAFAAAAVKFAETNPRLLVTEPGWMVTDAGEFEADEGEVTFSDGEHRFTVHWYPARFYRSYLRDRAMVSRPERSVLLGRTATTVRYYLGPAGAEYATMLAPEEPDGRVFVEVRGRLENPAEYDAVTRSLRPVGVEAWLTAMPRSVVVPEARTAVIRRMLRGVPLPPTFDRAALEGEGSVLSRYQLAVKVAGTVSCGWFESWFAAKKAGDQRRVREAVQAMSRWPDWPMVALVDGGGWAANVKAAARALATGKVDRGTAGSVVHPDGSGYELGPAWAVMLNCSEHYWRRPIEP